MASSCKRIENFKCVDKYFVIIITDTKLISVNVDMNESTDKKYRLRREGSSGAWRT